MGIRTGEDEASSNARDAKVSYWMKKAVEEHDEHARYLLRECDGRGEGLPKDEAEAVVWFRRAAEDGEPDAMCRLASCYSEGWGVCEDPDSAKFWYGRAADKGHAGGMVRLGILHATGAGVQRDVLLASHWFRKAAALGDPTALEWDYGGVAHFAFAELYANGDGVTQDEIYAAELYEEAADGFLHVDAMKKLGAVHSEGRGVEKNDGEAIHWYCEAAKRDDVEAKDWLKRTALAGNPEAMYEFAALLGESDEAVEWLSKAAWEGNQNAIHALEAGAMRGDERMAWMLARQSEYQDAIYWYRRLETTLRNAAKTGEPGALLKLSKLLDDWASLLELGPDPEDFGDFESDEAKERDEEADLLRFESEHLLKRAVDLGFPEAIAHVKELDEKAYQDQLAAWESVPEAKRGPRPEKWSHLEYE